MGAGCLGDIRSFPVPDEYHACTINVTGVLDYRAALDVYATISLVDPVILSICLALRCFSADVDPICNLCGFHLVDRKKARMEKRLEWRPVVYTAIGTGLGMLVNPYFPDNIVFFIRHIAPKLTETTTVSVGSEWYPYRTTQLLENSPLALVAFLAGVVALGLFERRMDNRTATALFVAIFFGLLLFQSRRFIEYFPPFALVFCALAWKPILLGARKLRSEAPPLDALATTSSSQKFLPKYQHLLAPAILGALLLVGAWISVQDARSSIASSKPYTLYSGAANWLEENSPAGARVFQTDWDDFPRLFFYNTHNTYLIGLDPTYMTLYDADLYDLWEEITQGDVEHPSDFIYPRFGAQYVVSDLLHRDFIQRAENDPGLELVFRDSDAVVFQVTEPK